MEDYSTTLIVIDGLDASGKSTQALLLSEYLESKGKTVCTRVHPSSDNFFGIRSKQYLYLKGKNAHFASALFYMCDVIRSILLYSWQKYDFLIFVRYLMGTAYLPSPLHEIAYHFFSLCVPKSKAMFFLDTIPEESWRRIRETRKKQEMFENVNQLEKIRVKGLKLAFLGSWKIINADKSINEVQTRIRKTIDSL